MIALAATGAHIRIGLDDLKEQAENLKEDTGLNLLPTLTRIEQSQTCPGGVFYL